MNPTLWINLEAIRHNASTALQVCHERGISIDSVVKGVCADLKVSEAILDGGIQSLMDSRLKNLQKLRAGSIDCRLGLLRIPMLSEIDELVEIADWCLVSMKEAVLELERTCNDKRINFEVLLMIDLGDLREGVWPDRVGEFIELFRSLKRVACIGVGTNLGCFGGVLPSADNMDQLVKLGLQVKTELGADRWLISPGGTRVFYEMLNSKEIPAEINHLRVGGGILRGMCGKENIPGFRQDTMRLDAELIEIYFKPTVPVGKIAKDAFGNTPHFEDRGIRRRGIVAIGRQDVTPFDLEPQEEGITILGASSDHLVLDIQNSRRSLRVGDTVSFSLSRYGALLFAFNSDYVEKVVSRNFDVI